MICIPPSGEYIDFAGAKNELLVVTSKGATRHRGSRFEIGGSSVEVGRNTKEIELQRIPITEDTWCYMYSDGMMDQFNEAGRKFSSPRLHALLGSLYTKDAETQMKTIDEAIAAWKGKEDQIDDQLLVGVKIERE